MRRILSIPARVAGSIALIALFVVIGNAQFRAGIQGVVSDTSGGLVPGATVTLTNKETNQSVKTQTSSEGFYNFSNLAPGPYSVLVEKNGFKKNLVENVKVEAEALNGLNITLEPGGISETVTVQAEDTGLQTEDPNVRKTITNDEVLNLPQAGRDPYELARLAPGVFGAGARNGSGGAVALPNTSGPGGSNNSIFQTENQVPISANGQRVSSNNYQIDGTSVNSQTWGGAAVITPTQESVKEVQVTASTYSAEDGRNSGVQFKAVSQNGTNQWHGSAFFKLNDPSLNAFNTMPKFIGTFDTGGPQRVEQKYKNYGGSFGGRIIKDKLFFFFAYEGSKNKTNNVSKPTFVETSQFRQALASQRSGTLSAEILSASGEPRIAQVLTQSCNGVAYGGCQVVNGGLDIGGIANSYGQYARVFSDQPAGSGLDGIPDLQLVQLFEPQSFNGNQYFTRIDFNPTGKDNIAFTSYFVPTTSIGSDFTAQSRPGSDIKSNRLQYLLGFIYNRVISTKMVNEARVNITRWGYNELNSNPDDRWDLPRVEIENTFNVDPGRLRFGPNWGLNTPGDIIERQLDFRDILRYVKGNHSLAFGAEYRVDLNRNYEIGGARPLYSFSTIWNFANGTPIFEQYTTDANGKPIANNTPFRSGDLAFFVQDNWKIRPNLTLNLGLRWEYFSPITSEGKPMGNLILDSQGGLAGATISTSKHLTKSDFNNFGPQIGFAWTPDRFKSKLVIRGGGGIGYDRLANALLANARRNPPNGAIDGICCGTDATEWGTPFVGGHITFVKSTDGTLFGYPTNPVNGGGVNAATGLPINQTVEIYGSVQNLPNAEVYRYSLEGQYQLPMQLVASLGYQGSQGRHGVRIDPIHITGPSGNANIGAAYFARADVNSSFNALLASLRGRLTRGLNFTINYRFAKSLDTDSFEAPCGCTNQSFPVDQKQEHGPSDFDVRHSTTASVIWDLPFYRHQNSWKSKLLGGWQASSIITYHTGFPWTPKLFGCLQNSSSPAAFCDPRPTSYNGTRPQSNSNDNFLRPSGIFGIPVVDTVFGTSFNGSAPFANPPAIGRNSLFGPKYFDTDLAIAKKFGLPNSGFLGESAAIDVRFNFFNLFNNLNLAPFGSNTDPTRVQGAVFGVATSALAGRTGEFQVRFSF